MSNSMRIYAARPSAAQTSYAAVATVAATAKTIVAVMGTAATTISLKGFQVSFASVTASDVPAVIEIGIITALGTATSTTPVQIAGSPLAAVCSAGYNHTVEPTYNRVFRAHYVPVNNGAYEFYFPLGDEPYCAVSQGFAMRVTSPQAQSVLACLNFAE